MTIFEISTFASQIFWLLISFVMLYVVFSKIIIPKIIKIYSEREKLINTAVASAKENHAKALELRQEYEKKLLESLQLREDKIAEISNKLNQEMETKLLELEQELTKSIQEFEESMEDFKEKSKKEIEFMSLEFARNLLKSIVKDNLTNEQMNYLINNNNEREL